MLYVPASMSTSKGPAVSLLPLFKRLMPWNCNSKLQSVSAETGTATEITLSSNAPAAAAKNMRDARFLGARTDAGRDILDTP